MAELASLGIEVQASNVDQATNKLARFANAARIAEDSVQGIGSGTAGATRIASSALDGMASRMKAVEKVSRDAERALAAQAMAAQKAANSTKAATQAANQNVPQMANMHNTANLAAQGFDIVTTAAGGMNAGLIGMQQGLQIAQVAMASGGGFARSLGAAFVGMLSPVTLLSVGLTTLAAVAIQSLTSWFSSSEKANMSLEKQGQLVEAVAEKWGAATPAIKAYADELERVKSVNDALAAGDIVARAQFSGAQAAIATVTDEFERMILVLNSNPGNVQFANAMTAAFQNLVQKLSEGKATADDVTAAQNALNQAMTTGAPEVTAFGNAWAGIIGQINAAVGAMVDARNEAGRVGAAMNAALNNPAYWRGAQMGPSNIRETRGDGFEALPWDGPRPGSRPLVELEGLPKVRGGGGPKNNDYQNAIRSAQERTRAIQAETAAQSLLNPAINDYGFAVARARAEADLLAAAERDKKSITPELNAQIQQTATALATATAAQARLTAETKKAQEYTNWLKSTTAGFVNELRSGLRSGEGFWKSFGNAALSVLDRITDRLLNDVLDAIFKVNGAAGGGGGGGFFGFLSSIFGGGGSSSGASSGSWSLGLDDWQYASGGYTGNGAAHQAAGIVHGGEFVFSKKATDRLGVRNLDAMHKRAKGYATGGHVTPLMPANGNNVSVGGSPQGVHVTVGVTVDENGNLQAYVKNVAKQQTNAAVRQYDANLPKRIADAQMRRKV